MATNLDTSTVSNSYPSVIALLHLPLFALLTYRSTMRLTIHAHTLQQASTETIYQESCHAEPPVLDRRCEIVHPCPFIDVDFDPTNQKGRILQPYPVTVAPSNITTSLGLLRWTLIYRIYSIPSFTANESRLRHTTIVGRYIIAALIMTLSNISSRTGPPIRA